MEKVIRVLAFCTLVGLMSATPAPNAEKKINWISLAEAEQLYRQDHKPILIDLYTSWCGWCKVMDKKTYSRPGLVDYVNARYHAVRFDAETRDAISWGGKSYGFDARSNVNGFAIDITRGQLQGFPTTVIVPGDGSSPQTIAGYLETKDMEPILKYFADGGYGHEDFEAFRKKNKSEW